MKVAIQGIVGSYSEEATRILMGDDVQIHECADFTSVFQALQSGEVELAVVPVWNKIIGEIKTTASAIKTLDLETVKEIRLPIRHALIGTKDAVIEELEAVISQSEALAQCEGFLKKNRHLKVIIGSDTAMSVKEVVIKDNAKLAAIGSPRAAFAYGGKILQENISDDQENSTLFYLLRRKRLC